MNHRYFCRLRFTAVSLYLRKNKTLTSSSMLGAIWPRQAGWTCTTTTCCAKPNILGGLILSSRCLSKGSSRYHKKTTKGFPWSVLEILQRLCYKIIKEFIHRLTINSSNYLKNFVSSPRKVSSRIPSGFLQDFVQGLPQELFYKFLQQILQ